MLTLLAGNRRARCVHVTLYDLTDPFEIRLAGSVYQLCLTKSSLAKVVKSNLFDRIGFISRILFSQICTFSLARYQICFSSQIGFTAIHIQHTDSGKKYVSRT